jgi:hypothetical protein
LAISGAQAGNGALKVAVIEVGQNPPDPLHQPSTSSALGGDSTVHPEALVDHSFVPYSL